MHWKTNIKVLFMHISTTFTNILLFIFRYLHVNTTFVLWVYIHAENNEKIELKQNCGTAPSDHDIRAAILVEMDGGVISLTLKK